MSTGNDHGFTLVEAVVALAILGCAGLATLEALGGQLRAADRATTAYIGAALAQDRLAAVAAAPIADAYPLVDSLARGTFPPPFEQYHWSMAVQRTRENEDLYEVQADIASPRSAFTIATLLYRPRPSEAAP